jgi:transcriptional regulator with XRE-family HTH domain
MRLPLQVSRQFGRALTKLRLKRKMTQQEVADACGLDIGYYGQIERGQRNPTLGAMHSIASVLRVKTSDLLKDAGL